MKKSHLLPLLFACLLTSCLPFGYSASEIAEIESKVQSQEDYIEDLEYQVNDREDKLKDALYRIDKLESQISDIESEVWRAKSELDDAETHMEWGEYYLTKAAIEEANFILSGIDF